MRCNNVRSSILSELDFLPTRTSFKVEKESRLGIDYTRGHDILM